MGIDASFILGDVFQITEDQMNYLIHSFPAEQAKKEELPNVSLGRESILEIH